LASSSVGEFIKLDTQGNEYEILQGAQRLLNERCLGIFAEVEFYDIYQDQKTHAELNILLKDYGFSIYGLFPSYWSTKTLDCRNYVTKERALWADTLYFKDPLDTHNAHRHFSDRDIQVLTLIAIMMKFYDYAFELIRSACL